jgi:hypothetical protein
MSKSGLYDITLVFIKKLPASILVKEFPESEDTIVLPLSQIEYVDAKKQGYVEVTMPEWLALEKELI